MKIKIVFMIALFLLLIFAGSSIVAASHYNYGYRYGGYGHGGYRGFNPGYGYGYGYGGYGYSPYLYASTPFLFRRPTNPFLVDRALFHTELNPISDFDLAVLGSTYGFIDRQGGRQPYRSFL